jgi:spoIIIJ-associated protein
MKTVTMKGKNVDDAVNAAIAVLGVEKDRARIKVIKEGKNAVMGIIGGEEAEVEVSVAGDVKEEAREILQNILDKMGLLAIVEAKDEDGGVTLAVKGEDMGRIIGKEGIMLKSLETVVRAMASRILNEKTRINIDAGDYREKRAKSLERLAAEVVDEVISTGQEKMMPAMSAADRRIIHLYIQQQSKAYSESIGEGRDRRLVIHPKG